MKKITKFKDFNKHLKIFILITTLIFIVVGILHFSLLVYGLDISIGNMFIPKINSYLLIFISLSMLIMGTYYYKALDDE